MSLLLGLAPICVCGPGAAGLLRLLLHLLLDLAPKYRVVVLLHHVLLVLVVVPLFLLLLRLLHRILCLVVGLQLLLLVLPLLAKQLPPLAKRHGRQGSCCRSVISIRVQYLCGANEGSRLLLLLPLECRSPFGYLHGPGLSRALE